MRSKSPMDAKYLVPAYWDRRLDDRYRASAEKPMRLLDIYSPMMKQM